MTRVPVTGPTSTVSQKARARGLHTMHELKLAVLRQRTTWWSGGSFHCPLCDLDFVEPRRAAEHIVVEQHPVLRMD
jgi:hypothetical protein